MIAAFPLANLIAAPLLWASEAEVAFALFAGIALAELGLLAIWAVLGPQRWIVRLPVTFAYAVLLCTMVIMGSAIVEPPPRSDWSEIARSYLLFLPLVFLAAQLPLWILRIATGCRIVRADAENGLRSTASRQFQLLDLFGAMTVLAVALGLASLGLSREEYIEEYIGAFTWPIVLIICLVCAGGSTFSTLPCLWAGLISRNRVLSTVVIAVYVLVMTPVLLTIGTAIAGSAPPAEAEVGFLLLVGGLVGVMLAVLHVVRRWGYVLRGAGRKRSVAPLAGGPTDIAPDGGCGTP